MGFWIFMLCSGLLIPVLMMGSGWLMWKHPPKNINSIYGYRTSRSSKNQDTWNFAQNYCGKLWWRLGCLSLVPSLAAMLPFCNSSEETIGTVSILLVTAQTVVMVLSIFPTERALKKTFDQDGNRISS